MALQEEIVTERSDELRFQARLAGHDVPDQEFEQLGRIPPVTDEEEAAAFRRANEMNARIRRN